MNLAIIGSRDFNDFDYAESEINRIILRYPYKVDMIVSGGAAGADTLGYKYAIKYKIPFKKYVPNWKLGKHAGMLRNTNIINDSDIVIAFWDGISNGTRDSINKAKKAKKELHIIKYNERKFHILFNF